MVQDNMGQTSRNRFANRFAIGLALGVSALALNTAPALAQDASPASATPASAAAPTAVSTGEIVVTANKREQKLRDVGIAISVLTSKELTSLNVTNATDVVRAIPNLHYNAYSSSQVVFNIRGVSQNDYGDQQEPPVAVYQDDSYSSSITTASFPIFDLARVEALRGPQGTLFGRNATGGAVQFISNQPTDEPGGYFTATYGSFNQTILEGAVSGPLGDGFTARLSGQYDRSDGYIKDITPGQPNRGADNHWSLRGIVKYSQTPDFTAKLTLRYTEADHERQAGDYSLAPACPNAQYQGEFLAANEVCPYWGPPGTSAPGKAAQYFYTNMNVPGSVANGYTNPAITPSQGGNPWETAGTGDAFVNRKIFGSTLRMDANLGGISLTSITDYVHLSKLYSEIGDGDPELPYVAGPTVTPATGPCAAPAQSVTCYASGTYFFQQANTDQYSQEFHAAAHMGNNYLTVGAFGMIINGFFNAKYATPFDQYDPNVSIHQLTDSYAFFAQDEWKFTDKLKLIGGLRYWHDRKEGFYNASEAFSGFSMHFGPDAIYYNDPTGVTPLTGVTVSPAAADPKYSGVTARAELDYKPTRDTLAYISYNRGSKSGGFTFSTGTPTLGQSVVDTINNIPYRPETLDDYEVGLKTRLGPKVELNLAAFYYDYHNYQAFEQVGYTQVVHNLPATNHGFEGDLTAHPIHGLTLQASGSLQYSHVDNVLLPDGATIVNHRLPQAPVFSANALARYEFDLAGGKASLQADALYSGDSCFTVMCAPVEREGAYHVENARIGFTPKGGNIDLAFFVNNLFQRAYRVYAFDGSLFWGDSLGIYAEPRTWGITATYRFGK